MTSAAQMRIQETGFNAPELCGKKKGNFTFGIFEMTCGRPLKNCDFWRLSLCIKESRYCNVIAPTSSKKGIWKKGVTTVIGQDSWATLTQHGLWTSLSLVFQFRDETGMSGWWVPTLDSWSASGRTVGSVLSRSFTWSRTSSGIESRIDFFRFRSCNSNFHAQQNSPRQLNYDALPLLGWFLPLLYFACTCSADCRIQTAVFRDWTRHRRAPRVNTYHWECRRFGSTCAPVPGNPDAAARKEERPCPTQ